METVVEKLELDAVPHGTVQRYRIRMASNGMGDPILMPVLVARGTRPGPVVGFTAAMHGNELNGIRVIHNLFKELREDVENLAGTVVGVPVVNVPGFLSHYRRFNDGVDLNRVMPGKAKGNTSEVYAARFMKRVVRHFNYLIDLHTASFGRVNSLYVRADMKNEVTRRLAILQNPEIIVHNKGRDGTLRSAAANLGIHSITVEVGDPQRFQRRMIRYSLVGIHNILSHLDMLPLEEHTADRAPIVCNRSGWIYTDQGGLLEVYPDLGVRVKKGELVARLMDVFGDVVREYTAPEDGVVVGKSTNPVCQSGARILHLGVEGEP